MVKVINRKVLNFGMALASGQTKSIGINIEFKPDEVILKQIAYVPSNGEENVYQLSSDLVSENVMCVFPSINLVSVLNIPFTLQNMQQNRVWSFQIQGIPTSGTGPTSANANALGDFGFMLEFVEYEKK
jgi:hypothetical protein